MLIGYNSNLHPAETVDELLATLDGFTRPLRERLGWERVGLDLRLGSTIIHELQAAPDRIAELRRGLDVAGAVPFTINAFPLSAFQSEVVKDRAYHPDWTTVERLQDSMAAVGIACALCDDELLTISTVPGSFKPWGAAANDPRTIAAGWGHWAAFALRHAEQTGRRVVLCPEPEPWCTLETSTEVAAFWAGPLREHGLAAAAAALDGDRALAARALNDHLAICYDTCHVSVAFEDQVAAVERCRAAGATALKVQFSACPAVLEGARDDAGIAALAAMREPRFLHQTALKRVNGGIHRILDLDELDGALAGCPDTEEIRTHFHIPIDRSPAPDGLTSTVDDSLRGLHAALAAGARHVAVETYTWSILAADAHDRLEGTARELEWLAARLD